MTITPDQARELLDGANPGPWFVHTDPDDVDGTYIHDNTGNMCVAIEHVGSDYRPADLELIAAAPDLAQTVIDQGAQIERLQKATTIARMTEEWGVEVWSYGRWCPWCEWTDRAGAKEELDGARRRTHPEARLVRRLVSAPEVIDGE